MAVDEWEEAAGVPSFWEEADVPSFTTGDEHSAVVAGVPGVAGVTGLVAAEEEEGGEGELLLAGGDIPKWNIFSLSTL